MRLAGSLFRLKLCGFCYNSSLLDRWNAGCYTAMRLFRELRQRGYAGGYGVVAA
jgi:hypothetical protein